MKAVEKAVKILKNKYNISKINFAIVVGSGLIDGCPDLENKIEISYQNLGLPKSKVKGHSGKLVVGKIGDKIVALVSRMHYYESGDITKVRIPIEIMAGLDCENVILLTSCGGINEQFNVGDIMLINDQINMSGINPLIGMDEIKFIDMVNCYDSEYRDLIKKISKKLKLQIKEGVFSQTSGPSYETMAEINMLKMIGADSVSMSTSHDCIIAKYYGMRVLGFSVIVNVFNLQSKLSHEEVLCNASKANQTLKTLLTNFLERT